MFNLQHCPTSIRFTDFCIAYMLIVNLILKYHEVSVFRKKSLFCRSEKDAGARGSSGGSAEEATEADEGDAGGRDGCRSCLLEPGRGRG